MTRSLPRRLPVLFAAALSACAGTADAPPPDQLHERIVAVRRAGDGSAIVTFEHSQRRFTIDPARSPDAAAMIASAEAARTRGDVVCATVAPSGVRTKGDDGPPFVLVRLAVEPASPR